MQTSAAALTPTTPTSPAANDSGETNGGSSAFLELLTGSSEPKTLEKTAATNFSAHKVLGGKTAMVKADPAATDEVAKKAATDGAGRSARAGVTRVAGDKAAPTLADTAAASLTPEETALPAALLAALSAGATQGTTEAAKSAGETATVQDDTTPRVKPKAARTATPSLAKRESADTTAKAETASGDQAVSKAEPTASTGHFAKSLDRLVTTVTAKADEPLGPTPAIALANGVDAAATATPGGGASTGTIETRIPLAREAAATAIAAPVLALRVHTKDGAMKAIEIRLDPVELGQVDVKLETGSDGKLKAVLSAENSESFELLKRESGALESALREAGVDLGEDGITFTLNEQGTGAGSSHADQREAAYGGASTRRDTATAQDMVAANQSPEAGWRSGLIDISA